MAVEIYRCWLSQSNPRRPEVFPRSHRVNFAGMNTISEQCEPKGDPSLSQRLCHVQRNILSSASGSGYELNRNASDGFRIAVSVVYDEMR